MRLIFHSHFLVSLKCYCSITGVVTYLFILELVHFYNFCLTNYQWEMTAPDDSGTICFFICLIKKQTSFNNLVHLTFFSSSCHYTRDSLRFKHLNQSEIALPLGKMYLAVGIMSWRLLYTFCHYGIIVKTKLLFSS